MKHVLSILALLLVTNITYAQNEAEEDAVIKTIEAFFRGFHARDSVQMKEVLSDDIVVQTIGKSKTGETILVNADISDVLRAIVSIPADTEFEEIIQQYDVRVDGPMANAWTPYAFHFDGEFSHCGVNSFQLLKQDGQWKIIYLIDTRRKEGCNLMKLKSDAI